MTPGQNQSAPGCLKDLSSPLHRDLSLCWVLSVIPWWNRRSTMKKHWKGKTGWKENHEWESGVRFLWQPKSLDLGFGLDFGLGLVKRDLGYVQPQDLRFALRKPSKSKNGIFRRHVPINGREGLQKSTFLNLDTFFKGGRDKIFQILLPN